MSNLASDKTQLTKSENFIQGVDIWTGFYRNNIHRFIEDYFGQKLKLFQKIIIWLINHNVNSVYLAARKQGKTYLLGWFCAAIGVLYPGIKIVITGGGREQGTMVIQKIMEGMNRSPNLRSEITYISDNENSARVEFTNGSTVRAVTASEKSRGHIANIIIYDEYRIIKKSIVDSVIKKFRGSERMPKFYDKEEYRDYPKERNKQIFLSSAYYKHNWMWNHFNGMVDAMCQGKKYFACILPYQLSVKEGLLSREQVLEDMAENDYDPVLWSMEMGAEFFGEGENAFFIYDQVDNNRKNRIPLYPRPYYSILNDSKLKYESPKLTDHGVEVRFISADIALMGGDKNDNSAFSIFQLIPQGNQQYIRNIIYMETMNGVHSVDQAIRIRQLYDDFECSYIVLDCSGVGMTIYENLVIEMFDKERDLPYAPFTSMNDDEMAERCKDSMALENIYTIKAFERFNSECAYELRDAILRSKIRFLVDEFYGREWLHSMKSFSKLEVEEQVMFEFPFVQTTAMINEMVNLSGEYTPSGLVKIKEPNGMRKDRYSSISYGNKFANILEMDLRNVNSNYDFVCLAD